MANEVLCDADWVVPAVSGLTLVERNGRWLCLNPEVPAWLCTTKPGALLLELVDGKRSVRDYFETLKSADVPVSLPQLTEFFQSVAGAKLFEKPDFSEDLRPWQDRKLSALYLHLTDRCNLRCTYCYRESSPALGVRHDSRRFSDMFEYIKPFSAPGLEVTFSGGEPLMHPGFQEIVETAVRLGYANILLTNGTLLTDQMADFIRGRFKFVKISLDGPNEEIHSRTRGKGNFARVLRGIEKLAERGVRVKVQVTLTRSALPYVAEVKKVLPDVPHVNVVYTPLLPMGRGAAMDGECIDNDAFYEIGKTKRSLARFVPGRRIRYCHAGAGNLSVADSGEVYPCHHFHSPEFLFGNIFHDPFEEIFYGEKIKDYVRSMDVEHNNPVCRQCEVRFLCGGGCHANNLHATGDHRGVDIFCSYLKRIIYDELFDRATLKPGRELAAAS